MDKTIGTIGSELNLKFRQGATFGPYVLTITNADKTPIDLSLYVFLAKIKKRYSSSTILANVDFIPVDLVNGKVSISISSLTTSLLKGNPDGNAEYVWDAEMTDSLGQVESLFYGTVESFSNV